jgi:hypothetical protein
MTTELPRRHHPISVSERRRSGNLGLNIGNNGYNEPSIGDVPASSEHRSSISHGIRTSSPSNIGGSPVIGTGDPHHQRTPSLGELHQELEQEQEAQVVNMACVTFHDSYLSSCRTDFFKPSEANKFDCSIWSSNISSHSLPLTM